MTGLLSHMDADTYKEEGLLKSLLTQHIVRQDLWIFQLILKNGKAISILCFLHQIQNIDTGIRKVRL